MKKYTSLFKQFNKLDTYTEMICKNVLETTKKSYPTSDKLLNFNKTTYTNLYKEWGKIGIFNHKENDITPDFVGEHPVEFASKVFGNTRVDCQSFFQDIIDELVTFDGFFLLQPL